VAANKEMICPMELRIKNFRVRGIVTLVVSKHRGVTLAFKNDPLEAVEVSSSFDSIPSTRRFLQAQIEGQVYLLSFIFSMVMFVIFIINFSLLITSSFETYLLKPCQKLYITSLYHTRATRRQIQMMGTLMMIHSTTKTCLFLFVFFFFLSNPPKLKSNSHLVALVLRHRT
jgi:hypothetical protein